jgi:hypothetical protein
MMDVANLFFTLTTCFLYFIRTFDMCLFDKHPIWRMPETDAAPTSAAASARNIPFESELQFTDANF